MITNLQIAEVIIQEKYRNKIKLQNILSALLKIQTHTFLLFSDQEQRSYSHQPKQFHHSLRTLTTTSSADYPKPAGPCPVQSRFPEWLSSSAAWANFCGWFNVAWIIARDVGGWEFAEGGSLSVSDEWIAFPCKCCTQEAGRREGTRGRMLHVRVLFV